MTQVRYLIAALLLWSLTPALWLGEAGPVSAQDSRPGVKYAFLVGVRNYDHANFTKLDFTLNDVHKLADVFQRSDYHVTTLSDQAGKGNKKLLPTRGNILSRLSELLPRMKRQDMLVIGLAGHGLQYDRASYFCPCDGNPHDAKTLVAFTEIYQLLGQCGAGVKLMLVDACRDDPRLARSGVTADTAPRPPRGVAALFSCSAGQKSYETRVHKHGLFMYHVLQGLNGQAQGNEGQVTWLSLADYVSRNVQREVRQVIAPEAEQKPSISAQELSETPVLVNLREQTGEHRAQRPPLAPARVTPASRPPIGNETVDGTGLWLNRLLAGRPIMGQGDGKWFIISDEVPLGIRERTGLRAGDVLVRVNGQRVLLGRSLNLDGLSAESQVTLQIYRRGVLQNVSVRLGVSPSNAGFAALVQAAAERGDALAQSLLGNLYYRGEGLSRDASQAAAWYRQSAAQKFAPAMNDLGDLYQTGSGVTKDLAEAKRLYEQASQLGYARAMVDIGDLYYLAIGVQEDNAEALRWFHKGARHDWAPALHRLGQCYQNGHGVDRDLTKALEYYQNAAELGWAPSCLVLGRMYLIGSGVPQNDPEAVKWFKKAASLDDAEGQAWLGWAHVEGRGVERDLKQASGWFRQAADQNHPEATVRLGECFARGWGETKNLDRAVQLYRRAAEGDHARGMYRLGLCYFKGEGVPQNYTEALRWFEKGANKGDSKSMNNVGYMYEFGHGVQRNLRTAVEWYRKAADTGSTEGLQNLQGLGVNLNPGGTETTKKR